MGPTDGFADDGPSWGTGQDTTSSAGFHIPAGLLSPPRAIPASPLAGPLSGSPKCHFSVPNPFRDEPEEVPGGPGDSEFAKGIHAILGEDGHSGGFNSGFLSKYSRSVGEQEVGGGEEGSEPENLPTEIIPKEVKAEVPRGFSAAVKAVQGEKRSGGLSIDGIPDVSFSSYRSVPWALPRDARNFTAKRYEMGSG